MTWTEMGGGFKFPYVGNGSRGTVFGAGLWLGGIDPGGNLKVAANSLYGTQGGSDFTPGPLDPETGIPYTDFPCEYLNQIWTVTGEEIIAFLNDWYDNRIIDDVHVNIFYWPGNGNPHFFPKPLPATEQGWAPFYDENRDGIYNPNDGDFPSQRIDEFFPFTFIIPNEINWTVFHDNTLHEETGGIPIRMEVQQTTWVMECNTQPEIENTIFVDYKLINRAAEDIDSFYAGIAVDFDIGCFIDDYIGCLPDHDAMIAYNLDMVDGDPLCSGQNTFGELPPVMSVKFIDGRYNAGSFNSFMYYYGNGPSVSSGQRKPSSPPEYYNFLTGTWRDGTPLTFGGSGYDQASIDFTEFAYPGNPNNPDEWSMLSTQSLLANRTAIGSAGFFNYGDPQYGVKSIQPGKFARLSIAFTAHSDPNYNHINIIDKMVSDDLKNMEVAYYGYVGIGGNYCQNFNIEEPAQEPEEPFISGIYPNPTSSEFTIAIPETTIEEVEIYNTAWQLIYSDKNSSEEIKKINISGWASGLYFLKIKLDGHILMRKIVKN